MQVWRVCAILDLKGTTEKIFETFQVIISGNFQTTPPLYSLLTWTEVFVFVLDSVPFYFMFWDLQLYQIILSFPVYDIWRHFGCCVSVVIRWPLFRVRWLRGELSSIFGIFPASFSPESISPVRHSPVSFSLGFVEYLHTVCRQATNWQRRRVSIGNRSRARTFTSSQIQSAESSIERWMNLNVLVGILLRNRWGDMAVRTGFRFRWKARSGWWGRLKNSVDGTKEMNDIIKEGNECLQQRWNRLRFSALVQCQPAENMGGKQYRAALAGLSVHMGFPRMARPKFEWPFCRLFYGLFSPIFLFWKISYLQEVLKRRRETFRWSWF